MVFCCTEEGTAKKRGRAAAEILSRLYNISIVKMKMNGKSFSFFLMNKLVSLAKGRYLDPVSRPVLMTTTVYFHAVSEEAKNYSKDLSSTRRA